MVAWRWGEGGGGGGGDGMGSGEGGWWWAHGGGSKVVAVQLASGRREVVVMAWGRVGRGGEEDGFYGATKELGEVGLRRVGIRHRA